jgi:hypothetical protein
MLISNSLKNLTKISLKKIIGRKLLHIIIKVTKSIIKLI